MDTLLTREEMDAIARSGAGAAPAPAPTPSRIDLAGGDRLLRALLPLLDPVAVRLAGLWRSRLSALLRGDLRVAALPAEIVSSAAWPEAQNCSLVASLRAGEITSGALVVVEPALWARIVARLFGGGRGEEHPAARAPTAVERSVLLAIVEAIAADAAEAFAGELSLQLTFERIETDARPASLERMGGAGIAVAATVQTGGDAGNRLGAVRIVLGAAALEPLRARVGRWPVPDAAAQESSRRIARAMRDATIEVGAILGQARLTMAQLVALRAGDLIHLQQSVGDPVVVLVEGRRKLRGRPAVSRSSLAVEIDGRIEEAP